LKSLSCCAALIVATAAAGCGNKLESLLSSSPLKESAVTLLNETRVPSPLVGQTWRLTSINGREALADVRVTAVFADNGRVTGSAGCNQYFGGARADGAEVSVGVLASTRMACSDAVSGQELAYLSALQKAKVWRVVATELRLGPDANVVTLVFRAE